jgi:hypothetical protein
VPTRRSLIAAGLWRPIVGSFYREVAATARDEAVAHALANKYRVEVPLPTPEDLRRMIVEELPFRAAIIRDNNIKSGT